MKNGRGARLLRTRSGGCMRPQKVASAERTQSASHKNHENKPGRFWSLAATIVLRERRDSRSERAHPNRVFTHTLLAKEATKQGAVEVKPANSHGRISRSPAIRVLHVFRKALQGVSSTGPTDHQQKKTPLSYTSRAKPRFTLHDLDISMYFKADIFPDLCLI